MRKQERFGAMIESCEAKPRITSKLYQDLPDLRLSSPNQSGEQQIPEEKVEEIVYVHSGEEFVADESV